MCGPNADVAGQTVHVRGQASRSALQVVRAWGVDAECTWLVGRWARPPAGACGLLRYYATCLTVELAVWFVPRKILSPSSQSFRLDR